MRRKLLDYLACPSCKPGLVLDAQDESNEQVMIGELQCSRCNLVHPSVGGTDSGSRLWNGSIPPCLEF